MKYTIVCKGPRPDGSCYIGIVGLNGCFCYQDGLSKPNYPVPAVRANNITGGGIKGFFTYCAPMFVDWSRGWLEVY